MKLSFRMGTTIRFSAFWLLSFLTGVGLFAAPAWATNDLVFDIDQTLLYTTTAEMAAADPRGTFQVEGKYYRYSDHALELLAVAHSLPDTRVSYFSGGEKSRNEAVVSHLYADLHQRFGLPQAKPYLILNRDNMTPQSGVDVKAKFWQRYKKDLSQFFALDSTILVDDLSRIVPDAQEGNVLWTGITYNDRPRYTLKMLEDPAIPHKSAPDVVTEWRREREKLVRVAALLSAASEVSQRNGKSWVRAMQRLLQAESAHRWSPYARGLKLLHAQPAPSSCHDLLS